MQHVRKEKLIIRFFSHTILRTSIWWKFLDEGEIIWISDKTVITALGEMMFVLETVG